MLSGWRRAGESIAGGLGESDAGPVPYCSPPAYSPPRGMTSGDSIHLMLGSAHPGLQQLHRSMAEAVSIFRAAGSGIRSDDVSCEVPPTTTTTTHHDCSFSFSFS